MSQGCLNYKRTTQKSLFFRHPILGNGFKQAKERALKFLDHLTMIVRVRVFEINQKVNLTRVIRQPFLENIFEQIRERERERQTDRQTEREREREEERESILKTSEKDLMMIFNPGLL